MKLHVLFVLRNYLKASRKGLLSFLSIFSVLGVFIGVAALILVIGIMTGFQQELRNRIMGMTPHILVHKLYFTPFPENKDHVDKILAIKNVISCEPFIVSKTVLVNGEYTEGVVLKGVKKLPSGVRFVSGEESFEDGKIYLGLNVAASLAASPTDTIKVYSPTKVKRTPFGMVMGSQDMEVGGVFDAGLYDYNTSFAFTTLRSLQNLLELGDSIAGYEVYLNDPFQAEKVQKEIDKALGFPYLTSNWMELNRTVFQALKLEKLGMFLVLALIVIVASFGIISVLMLLVTQKTREIGVLRAMGFTRSEIAATFVLLGMTLAVIGIISGLAVGVGLAFLSNRFGIFRLPPDVYFIDRIPILVRTTDLLFIVTLALIVSFIASLIPSLRANRLEPVEAIRYE